MSNLDLTSYSRETLEHILRVMKQYKISLKQIGKRAVLIDPENPPAVASLVEYAPSIDATMVEKYALACIKLSFPDYTGAPPLLRKNPELTGGIRVFVWDDMVDVSFQRFETLLKK